MKKCLLFLSVFLLMIGISFGENVDPQLAETVAKNYLKQSVSWGQVVSVELAEELSVTTPSQFLPGTYEKNTLVYVFNVTEDNGFVVVSGDDVATPILAYVEKGSYNKANLPDNFRKWMDGYKRQIAYAIHNNLEAEESVIKRWEILENGGSLEYERSTTAVNPLMSTIWNQTPYVNDLCPGGSVTGCVATAMAQVMKFWDHPAQGSGMHSYNHETYGTLSANFGATAYQWSSMPNDVQSSNNAVATLMYHCGVSVDMNYSPNVSGAWVVESDSPICSESAFKNYFGYATSLHGEKRDGNYNTSQWVNMVKAELNASRPLLYAGFGSGGGHAFVCDGYDNNDYFHFNWGWGGAYDGYFSIDALDPGGTGTGGGSGGYNSGHQGVFGVQPATSTSSYDLRLYENVVVSPNPIAFGQAFSVSTKIGNFGNNNFSGDVTAVVFDNNGTSVEFVEIISGDITSQYWVTALFENSGSAALLPGSYTISLYYRPTGQEWIKVGDGDYNNSISFTVGNENDIKLYEAMSVSVGNTITNNQAFSIYLNVGNFGTTDFYGTFDVSIYDLEGYHIQTIDAMHNMSLQAQMYYTNGLTFNSSGLSVDPGSYLLAIQHKQNGGSWELTGSNTYANPIQVIITAQGLQGDMYENNDDLNNAYSLPVSFSGNNTSVYTTGSNSHTGSDYDYYKLNLPTGWDYTISTRAHDSYNSGNGQSYTNDVLWSFHNGSYWSDAYDDVMLGNITVRNGGTIAFLVAPYFLGETGTYLMDFQISRSPASIDDVSASNIKVYPNPARDYVYVTATHEDKIESIQINDLTGKQLIRYDNLEGSHQQIDIPVQDLPHGTYIMLIQTEQHLWQKKIIKFD